CALLSCLEAALVLADQPRTPGHQNACAIEAAHVLADHSADVTGYVGVDRGLKNRGDHRALRDGGRRIEVAGCRSRRATDASDTTGKIRGRTRGRSAGECPFSGRGRGDPYYREGQRPSIE